MRTPSVAWRADASSSSCRGASTRSPARAITLRGHRRKPGTAMGRSPRFPRRGSHGVSRRGTSGRDIRLVHRGLLPARPRGVSGTRRPAEGQRRSRPSRRRRAGPVYRGGRPLHHGPRERRAGRRPDPANHPRSPIAPSRTTSTPLAGGDVADIAAFERDAVARGAGVRTRSRSPGSSPITDRTTVRC